MVCAAELLNGNLLRDADFDSLFLCTAFTRSDPRDPWKLVLDTDVYVRGTRTAGSGIAMGANGSSDHSGRNGSSMRELIAYHSVVHFPIRASAVATEKCRPSTGR